MALNRDKILKGAEKFVQKGKIDNAIREYEKLLKLNPNDVNTINRVGDLYNRIGQVDRAVELYERIANTFATDGFVSKAIAIFKKISRLVPDRVEIFERLADLYIQQGLVIEARSQYQVLADWFMKNDDIENGIQTMRKLVQVDPENHMAHLRLADLLFRSGNSDEAIGVYERLGSMLLGRGKVDEAERLFRHALEQDPPSGEFLAPMCDALVDCGNTATAREFLIEAQKRSPDSVNLRIIALRVALATGDSREAMAAAEQVLAEHRDHPDVPGLAGRAFLAGGETAKAKELLFPFAQAMLDRGNHAIARGTFFELYKALPQDRDVLSLGLSVLSPADDQTVILELRSAIADNYFQAAEWDEARRLYLELRQQEPDNTLFAERLRELDGQGGDDARQPSEPDRVESADEPGVEEEAPSQTLDEPAAELEPEIIEFEIPDDLPGQGVFAEAREEPPAGRKGPGFDPQERVAEASVFAKYGLVDKAISHLESILAEFPEHLGAREKLVELAAEAGRLEYAVVEAGPLVEAYRAAGDDAALSSLMEALPQLAGMPSSGVDEVIVEVESAEDVEWAMPETAAPSPFGESDFGMVPHEFEEEVTIDVTSEDVLEAMPEVEAEGPAPDPFAIEAAVEEDGFEVEGIEFEAVELEPRTLPQMGPSNGLEFEEVALSDFEPDVSEDLPEPEAEPDAIQLEHDFEESPPEEDAEKAFASFDEAPAPAFEQPALAPVAEERQVTGLGILDELAELERSVKSQAKVPSAADPTPAAAGSVAVEPEVEEEAVSQPEVGPGPPTADMEQLDSFIDNSLYEDAARILMRLEGDYPNHSSVSQRRASLKAKGFLMEAVASPIEDAEDLFADEAEEYVDLAAELEKEMAAEEAMVEEAVGSRDGEAELEEVFREFQKGVAEQLSEEDSDTHFNLGIAYKEMGLLPEAIREFQVSSRDPVFFVECCSMIGVCYVEQGLWEQGASWYSKALSAANLSAESETALKYDLATALEGAGDFARALELFEEVALANPSFRNVSIRLSELGEQQYAN